MEATDAPRRAGVVTMPLEVSSVFSVLSFDMNSTNFPPVTWRYGNRLWIGEADTEFMVTVELPQRSSHKPACLGHQLRHLSARLRGRLIGFDLLSTPPASISSKGRSSAIYVERTAHSLRFSWSL